MPHDDETVFDPGPPEGAGAAKRSLTPMVGEIPREIPVRLGKYTIDRQLGQGAMGVVYLAHQDDLQRPVALKLLLHGPHSSEAQRQRFEREARAIARLRHPNLVSVHEVGTYEGQPFFTMDYVDGMPLDVFVRERNITSTAVIADLCATLADAVQYAHDNGIVHRDLKPGNILVDRTGKPVITDFGLAKDMDAQTMFSMAGDVMGTPAFMSPEQAEGRVEHTGAHSDVYSLGAILYALLAGKPPFEGKTLVETLSQVIHDDPLPVSATNPRVEGELGSICLKAMEKEPALRYPSAGEMAEDLRRFINGYPVLARPWTWRRAARKFARRHRRELAIAGSALVLIAAAAVVTPALFSQSYLDVARRHLGSADPAVRADTAATLAREIAEPEQLAGPDRPAALALLLGQLAGDDPAVQEQALDFLGAHGSEADVGDAVDPAMLALLQAQAADNNHPGRRDAAIRALGAVRKPGIAAHLVERVRTEPNPAVRLKLVRALGTQGSMEAIGPLMDLAAHDPLCRAEARAALDRTFRGSRLSLFAGQDSQVKQALSGLTDAMARHDQQIQDIMGAIDGSADAVQAYPGPYGPYQRILDQGSESERIQAVHALRETGEPGVVPILLELLGHPSRYVGAAAAIAIAELDPAGAEDELRARLDSPSADVRRDAALALGFTRQPRHVDPLLVALAQEPSLDTAEEIIFALGELQSPDARSGLEAAARRHPRLQTAAEDALRRLPEG